VAIILDILEQFCVDSLTCAGYLPGGIARLLLVNALAIINALALVNAPALVNILLAKLCLL
jgi:hypothetical protein